MAKKDKYFRIATEGATTDGREISATWINQMAANYDPKKYGARINLEHMKGICPDSLFKAYGDVTALKTEVIDGKAVLFAQIDPIDELIDLSKKRQKIYTSMEVQPNFANTGEAYLVGLAITDSPASLGTEMLKFSAQASNKPFASRKQSPENLFSEATECDLDFDVDKSANEGNGLLEKALELINKFTSKEMSASTSVTQPIEQEKQLNTLNNAVNLIAQSQQFALTQLWQCLGLANELEELKKSQAQDRATLDVFKQQLIRTDASSIVRPIAVGGQATQLTDC